MKNTHMKIIKLFIFCSVIGIVACNASKNTILAKYNNCIEHAVKIPFEIEGGGQGFTHNVKPACVIGGQLADFEMTDIEGNKINTRELKGQISVFHFWFIKCKPCLEEMPDLNKLREKYKDNNINFFAISLDSVTQLQLFFEKQEFNFRQFPNGQKIIEEQLGGSWGYPSTWVFDKENKVKRIFRKMSAEDLMELEGLLM